MIYRTFQDKQLSLLGFGAMRLPVTPEGSVDEPQVREMVRLAMEQGVNYFDTAWPYHAGESETVLGRVLGEYDRDRFYLADKFPGHQVMADYHPAAIFEAQLKKCGVEYFDFYLLHNINESSIGTYLDPQWEILDYLKEQKRLGRIRHLGFSCHGDMANLTAFLDVCGEDMEFCQIQLNYLDWTLQNAREKYELLTERGIPVWVMEPVRGGRLAQLGEDAESRLKAARPGESVAAWSFRFLQALPNVTMILSGMSDVAQMEDNLKTFAAPAPLRSAEQELVLEIAEQLKNAVPCTACRYCCDGCPMGLDIPRLLSLYNDIRFSPAIVVAMRLEALPADKHPSACIDCGRCTRACPQGIHIPAALRDFSEALSKFPSWAEICRQRDAEQKG